MTTVANLPTNGRKLAVFRGSPLALVASVRTKSLTVNSEPVDITTDDDSGWKKLLDAPGEKSVEIQVAGVLKDETLAQESASNTDLVQPMEFRWPGPSGSPSVDGKFAGDFFLSSFKMGGEYKGEGTFEATFVSTGAVAFTAAT